MPVNIIENWSEIQGLVLEIAYRTEIQGFSLLKILVDRVDPVEGFANLMADTVGHEIEVHIPSDRVGGLPILQNSGLLCRVRKAGGNRIFVHRDHLQVVPGE